VAGVFITGTDTGVGKTYFASLLLKSLREERVDAVGYKPVCCGERTDAEDLVAAGGGVEPLEQVNPIWFHTAFAPAVALELEGGEFSAAALGNHGQALADRHEMVVCEGVGGWAVPLTREESCSDLARALGWPVILVVANRLGAINHTLLTVEAIARSGLPLAGVVLNHLEEERDVAMVSNESILRSRISTEAWTTLMPGQDWLEADFLDSLR
jgi:dethiobiotin synthetase